MASQPDEIERQLRVQDRADARFSAEAICMLIGLARQGVFDVDTAAHLLENILKVTHDAPECVDRLANLRRSLGFN